MQNQAEEERGRGGRVGLGKSGGATLLLPTGRSGLWLLILACVRFATHPLRCKNLAADCILPCQLLHAATLHAHDAIRVAELLSSA